jgi:D-tyrosyl-tRNA(Tyr) deacylase
MLALIQRVLEASVSVDSGIVSAVDRGLLVFLGVKQEDNENEARYLAAKCANLRIFNDENGKMNISLLDTGFSALVVSQFTLHADTRHGNRPSFTGSAEPALAEELYKIFIEEMKYLVGFNRVAEGKFGAMMKIKLINDGPVTITLKSKNEY